MARKTASIGEVKKQEEYVQQCERELDTAKARVKEAKADLETALLRLRHMARGDDPELFDVDAMQGED